MITISKELRQAVQESKNELVRLIDPETKTEYIVLPAEKFAQIQGAFYDDSPLSAEEQTALLVELGLSIGWDDPEMDVYNELDPRNINESSSLEKE